jgi:uncharacterized protein (DUF169 family)
MKRRQAYTYTLLHKLSASPSEPMPAAIRTSHLTRIYDGLARLERDPQPTPNDWRLCSDAVNVMEALVTMGVCNDASGLIDDAVKALALTGARHVDHGQPIRLDGAGIQAVRAVVEDYSEALEQISHRTAVAAHRKTERRIRDIVNRKGQQHDVLIVGL